MGAPLMAAAQRGSRELAAILLRAGADAAATQPDGSTALQYAAQHGATDTIESLLGRARPSTPLAPTAVPRCSRRAWPRRRWDPAARGGRRRDGRVRRAHRAAPGERRLRVRRCRQHGRARARPAEGEGANRGQGPRRAARAGGATRRHRGRARSSPEAPSSTRWTKICMPLMLASANGHRDTAALPGWRRRVYRRGHDTAFSLARDHKHEDVLALLRGVEEEHGRRMSTTAQAVRGSI